MSNWEDTATTTSGWSTNYVTTAALHWVESGKTEVMDWLAKWKLGHHVKVLGMEIPAKPINCMFMLAKYPGTCKLCYLKFPNGTPIAFIKGYGARHIGCWYRNYPRPGSEPMEEMLEELADRADVVLTRVLWWYDQSMPPSSGNGPCLSDNVNALHNEPSDHHWQCSHPKAPWNKELS